MTNPKPQNPARSWIYDGIFGPLSALPSGFVPSARTKPQRNFDELDPWIYDTAFTPSW